jgi:hypothetical protein
MTCPAAERLGLKGPGAAHAAPGLLRLEPVRSGGIAGSDKWLYRII